LFRGSQKKEKYFIPAVIIPNANLPYGINR
jgi:hypothetical protein